MKFDLTKPCPDCPFRTDCRQGWLGEERAEEIADSITRYQQSFPCHKTTQFDDDGESIPHDMEQHCAGAMILLEKMEMPNQMMRIAERLGAYSLTTTRHSRTETPRPNSRERGGRRKCTLRHR